MEIIPRNCCYPAPIVPFAFEQGWSMLENLAALQNKVNEIIVQLNNTPSVSQDDLSNAISNLQNYLENQIKVYSNNTLSDSKKYTDSEVEKIENTVNEIIAEANRQLQNTINEQNTKINQINIEFQNKLDDVANNITVYSPVTGENGTLQQALIDLYSLHRVNSLSAPAYDNLKLSAPNYDNRKITSPQYDFNAKEILTA